MRSIVTVITPADDADLTSLERVKRELGIATTDATRDETLEDKISEASDDIEAALGFRVVRETVAETFWHEPYDVSTPAALILDRTPVASIASVVADGVTISSSLYRYDAGTGELFAVDSSGYPSFWCFSKSVIVTYDGGYLPPSEGDDSDLPPGIQGACVELVSSFWASKGRDPSVRAEEIPGVISKQYWVGAVGEAGELPPSVVAKLAPYRRAIA